MNIKQVPGFVCGLCLLLTPAIAGADNKGIINTLDLKTGKISIAYVDLRITAMTRVRSHGGSLQDTDDLAVRQHVSYSADALGNITQLRIYDPMKLIKQGFYTGGEFTD